MFRRRFLKKRADRRVAAMYFRGAKDRIFLFFCKKGEKMRDRRRESFGEGRNA